LQRPETRQPRDFNPGADLLAHCSDLCQRPRRNKLASSFVTDTSSPNGDTAHVDPTYSVAKRFSTVLGLTLDRG
jgi:hypothetical protein